MPGVPYAQHSTLAMLKEMLFTLDLAVDTGTDADRAAADRLQRKCELSHHQRCFATLALVDMVSIADVGSLLNSCVRLLLLT